MRIAISQPTYLPWMGYFDLIDQVDQFVMLDDVQFVKRSWDQRNRIKSPAGLQWLTVPAMVRGRFEQRLCDVVIDRHFAIKHLRAIEMNYAKTTYFEKYYSPLKAILENVSPGARLVELNIALIEWLAGELAVRTPTIRSSRLDVEGKRSGRLISICRRLGAEDYVSPRSAAYVLDDLEMFEESGQRVWFHNYIHPAYTQRFPPFLPYASTIDLLFNAGPESGAIMRGGRRDPFTSAQLRDMPTAEEGIELESNV